MPDTLNDKLARFDPHLPLARAQTIPSLWYFDPEIYAAEQAAIFGGTWQAIARTDQLQKPSTFVTANLAGEPILIVRDQEGLLRAFFNVCRHRAAQVINEPCGEASRLRCRYHGWTYDLAGRLRGTPEFDGVADFRRQEQGLTELAVDSWGPLVAVHLDRAAAQEVPLADSLSPMPRLCAGLGIDKLQFAERREYELACNWKVFVDNYLDGGYHVNTVHPALAGVIDYARYRTELYETTNVQISPLSPPADKSAQATIGNVRTGESAYYWWIFPNLMLNIYEGLMDTNLVLPLGPGRCKVIMDFYFADASPQTAEFIRQSVDVAHQIQLEDVGVCEEVQCGLRSRSYSTGRFSVKREAGGYHFHQLLAQRLTHGPTRAE